MSALPKPQLFEPGRRGNKNGPRDYSGASAKGRPRPGDVLSTGRVARLVKVSPCIVIRWIDAGAMRGYRLPGSADRRVHALDLAEFMLAHGLFRRLAECLVVDGGLLYRCRVHDRWGEPVARVAPGGAPEGAGLDWLPGEPPRYTLKAATPEAFQVLMDAGFRFEDGR